MLLVQQLYGCFLHGGTCMVPRVASGAAIVQTVQLMPVHAHPGCETEPRTCCRVLHVRTHAWYSETCFLMHEAYLHDLLNARDCKTLVSGQREAWETTSRVSPAFDL